MAAAHDLATSVEARADAETVARVLAGDTQAFTGIVQRHQARLHRYAMSMVLDRDDATDLVQEVLVRAYVSLGTCRDPLRFRAWLFQILRRRCLDYLKDIRRRNVRLDDAGQDIPDESARPGDAIERAGLQAQIGKALRALPPLLREAFVMHHVDGHPYDVMADLLDASVSALKMRVARAREQLQASLLEAEVTERRAGRLSERRG